ncbi:iron complex outermembrane recepter protein [Pseudarcicella hirudinis]|uniref:Iron complex outermembrane recepter protein n=2 Tax=Pseudarcicella hirudinis TaxID=1079859 RepID=A0A1I5SPK6_9BACT|nr:TonB-dependent receptor [Pseudarcicella hirudinis]SFP72571.1 iron complex outermembrane recepter protein [Pseudarcicella hirudinis]
MRSIFTYLLTFYSFFAFAQNASIKGKVSTLDGKPAEFVNVQLNGTNKGTITNENGEYKIDRVKAGIFVLKVNLIGLETKEQQIEIKTGQNLVINFTLAENANQLQEVVVLSGKSVHKESEYVSKMPLKNLENPQVYNVVSSDLLKEQAITNYEDALKNVPGIQKLWESTGRGGDGGSYYSLRGFEAQANMVNGLPGLTNGSLDPANIERVEVIKGPSGTLFGSSLVCYGGFINTVTKKPYATFGGEIGYIAGSFGLNRVTADVNTPLTKTAEVALRVNTSYQTENSFQDAGFRNSFFFAPTLSYKVNEKLSFLINTEFMQEEKTTPPMLFLGRNTPLQFADLQALNYNTRLSFYSNDLSMKNPRYNLQGQMTYKISDKWTSQTVLSRGMTRSDGYYNYIYDNENGHGDFSLWITKSQSQTITSDFQQNFIGDFTIAGMRNRMVIGVDYFERKVIYGGSGYGWLYNLTPQGKINYVNPATGDTLAPRYLTQVSVDNVLATSGTTNYNPQDATYSAYVSDVVNITPKLLAMGSLRLDYFDTQGDINTNDDNYTQTALSPKFGLLYQLIPDKVTFFTNYMNGFRNLGPVRVSDPDGSNPKVKAFKPEHANQLEFGVKTNLFSDRLNATISYYDIEVGNLVTADPSNFYNSLQGGEAQSKGFEIDLNVNPLRGLNVIAGYSYNDSKIIKGDEANVWLETGKRPIWAGAKNLVNFWTTYKFNGNILNGFGLGLGGNYASPVATLDSKVTGTFLLPGYTVINTSVFYNTSQFRVALNINNITDKAYFNGGWSTLNPQKPRNYALSFAYKF